MTWQTFLVGAYFVCLMVLAVYGLHRYYVVYLYKKYKTSNPIPKSEFEELPRVTIQLPIYNEHYVVKRLIESVCRIDYPKERLEIQVLDDSTDDTVQIAGDIVDRLRADGCPVVHIHRTDRTGFKAGALAAGLGKAKGEFVAIFDADFLPDPSILRRTIHYFTDAKIGMVQTRWGHLNESFSLLTRIQSIFLDGHFVLEHTARNRSGRFFNFNGTAGIWRRSCIEEAGGWQHDTLTEDLDISYRAQMQGWNFVFLRDLVTPGEVPVAMTAFKTQQHRWAKGSVQTCKKLLPGLWKSQLPLRVKMEATFHLTSNFAYLLVIMMSVLMFPVTAFRASFEGGPGAYLLDTSLFLMAFLSVCIFYTESQREIHADWARRIAVLPLVLSVGIGLSVNNAKAVLEAVLGKQTPFKRTPKYAVIDNGDSWKGKKYWSRRSYLPFVELGLAVYFAGIVVFAIQHGLFAMIFFLLLFLVGFGYVGGASLIQRPNRARLALNES